MLGERYVVEHGDTLWRVAAKTLGDGAQWPRIWRYNNRPAIARVNRRALADPDALEPGQSLLIPRLPGERCPAAVSGGAATQDEDVRAPLAFKYRLDVRWLANDIGTASFDARVTGDLLLITKQAYPAAYLTHRTELEQRLAIEADRAFAELVYDHRLIFDPAQHQLRYRSALIRQSTAPSPPSATLEPEAARGDAAPAKLRADLRIPKLEGAHGLFHYVALGLALGVTITPVCSREPRGTWSRALGAGLVVTAGVMFITALVDEWVPLVGRRAAPAPADAAGGELAHGLALLGGSHVNLPSTPLPGHARARATFTRPPR